MNKKFSILTLTVFTLVVMTLPMIPTAQAKKGGIPTEIFHDLEVTGGIAADNPAGIYPEMQGNMQYAEYTAHCDEVTISWDFIEGTPQQSLTGTATYVIEYKLNLKTQEATPYLPVICKGVAHIKTIVALDGGGTFEGEMIWVGDLLLFPNGVIFYGGYGGNCKWHTFFKGTDAYEGWTIIQNMNTHPTEYVVNNHLIKPVD